MTKKLYFNGNVITVNNKEEVVQAVAIEDGKIIKVGTNEEILSLKDNDTEVIDLEGKTMLPGFIDPHGHIVPVAQTLMIVTLGDVTSKEELLATDFHGITVAEKLIEQTGVIGEKIEIGSFERIEGPFLGAYIHAGNKIAAITSLSANVEGGVDAAKAVSMQIAAMNPIALDETQVSQETIDKELEIERDILTKEGKPANIIDNILKGKMQKFYKENTLVHQAFIKDGSQSVADYVKSVNADLKVVGFVRVSLA